MDIEDIKVVLRQDYAEYLDSLEDWEINNMSSKGYMTHFEEDWHRKQD